MRFWRPCAASSKPWKRSEPAWGNLMGDCGVSYSQPSVVHRQFMGPAWKVGNRQTGCSQDGSRHPATGHESALALRLRLASARISTSPSFETLGCAVSGEGKGGRRPAGFGPLSGGSSGRPAGKMGARRALPIASPRARSEGFRQSRGIHSRCTCGE